MMTMDYITANERLHGLDTDQNNTAMPTWVTAMMCSALLAEMYYCLLLITN